MVAGATKNAIPTTHSLVGQILQRPAGVVKEAHMGNVQRIALTGFPELFRRVNDIAFLSAKIREGEDDPRVTENITTALRKLKDVFVQDFLEAVKRVLGLAAWEKLSLEGDDEQGPVLVVESAAEQRRHLDPHPN